MVDPFTPGLLQRLPVPPHKVALLRASRIGDFICATPALRAIRHALPDGEITLITLPMLHDLAQRSPHVDRIAAFPGYPGLAEQLFDARRAAHFFLEMQAEQFDLALQLQGSGVYTNPFTLMLSAQWTAGFVRPGDGPGLLAAALPLPERGHEIERVLALPTFLGVTARGTETEYPLWAEDHAAADQLLRSAEPPLIGLHAAARDATRRWSLQRFATVATELQHEQGGTIVLLGEAAERASAEELARSVSVPCLDLTGRTSLPILGAVIQRLAVLITNDTGPAHIAYALRTPTVTIFGGGDPSRYGPLHAGPFEVVLHPIGCRPCHDPTCPIGNRCLDAVSVKDVLDAVAKLLP
ncbi:MAG: glycosyltransferase family 9 protein [Pseudomonadota bacterium]|nr:glycosyltransferase family 9 protein [Chloroflexota bacterium]MDP9414328.1 glycosyltransferase family 9 protein [Pseudomonadota bacterium]